MHQSNMIKRGKPGLASAFRRLRLFLTRQLDGCEADAREAKTYEAAKHHFLRGRLQLSIGLGAVYLLSFLPLDLASWLVRGHGDARNWLLTGLARLLALLGCFVVLRLPGGQGRLAIVFLSLSWSMTLTRQIAQTLTGTIHPDSFSWTLFSWTLTFFSQATLMPVHWPLHLVSQLVALGYYFGVNPLLGFPVVPVTEDSLSLGMKLFWICCIPTLSVYLYERLARAEFEARQQLAAERERSEKLLLNILPEPIAERLKQDPRTIADSFTEVTVLFADIVGFTRLSEQISPTKVVELLNQTFSIFDQLAERHGLEKIKTIGDAYMVVCGLPEPRSDHAEAIADMALEMQQALGAFNQRSAHTLQIRIGIHTGPVVAGVIGMKKFAYDLWGDTVNTASRMESHSIPGQIQVSKTTYERLKQHYRFEERGLISIKSKGDMQTYLLRGRNEDGRRKNEEREKLTDID